MVKETIEITGKVNSEELKKEFKSVQKEVNETTKSVDKLSESATKDLKNVEKQADKTEKGVKGVGAGFKVLGTAMKAAGIGLIVAVVAKLTQAFSQNQKVVDAVSGIFETINIVFSQVTNAIVNAYESAREATNGFDALGKVMSGLLTLALTPIKTTFFAIKLALQQAQLTWEKSFFGDGDPTTINELNKGITETKNTLLEIGKEAVNAGKDIVNNFSEAVGEVGTLASATTEEVSKVSVSAAREQAKALIDARNAAQLAVAEQQRLIELYDQQAEQQRQIRDDERKSINERIEANNRLNEVLEKQQEAQLKQAELQIRAAQLELQKNDTIENQVALTEALANKQGVLAQIEGFRSEQKVNEASLERELLELQNSRSQAEAELSFEKQRAAAEGIENERTRLERLKEIALEERKFELERLQQKIDDTNAETQARVDAEIEFAQRKFELNEQIKESDQAVLDFEKKAANEKIALEQQVLSAKLGLAQRSLQLIAEVAGNGSKIGKAAAIVQATISGVEFS